MRMINYKDAAPTALKMPPERGARRTVLGEDENLMPADGNSFPVFILGWTMGAVCPCLNPNIGR
jgi:hypothetical protein